MTMIAGTTLGPYEIVAPLGAGGMGEVYKARDTRLDRTVAIKVLPAHVATDPNRRERFEREARVISQLNHPHICTLYDVGQDNGIDYLVVEYLEGQTLAERLARSNRVRQGYGGPPLLQAKAEDRALPVAEALAIAIQIADALDAAHRKGIIHRDLKPANVMLTKTGAARQSSPQAKLLDFGIAKAIGPARAGPHVHAPDLTATPTIPATLTADGTLLGTVQYMAPEQLEGREADARSDPFAFGAVLYEMVTGRRAFGGESQASVIAAILETDPPPIGTAQSLAPPQLDHIVQRCLAKDPDERWQTAADLKHELTWVTEVARPWAGRPGDVAPSASRLLWMAGVLAALVAGSIASALYVRRAPAHAPEMRLQIATPGGDLTNFAISPDGRKIVFAATTDGKRQLWLRPLDAETAQPLVGTEQENGRRVFWSPDSRSIGFFADGQLKRIDMAGGPPLALARAPNPFGGTWSAVLLNWKPKP